MNTDEILDWNALSALGLMPEKGEEVIWAGQPRLVARVNGTTRITRFWVAYYVVVAANIRLAFLRESIWHAAGALAVVLVVQVIPYLLARHQLSRTAYVVTNHRIVLRLWRWFREKVHVLRYDDFQKSTYNMEYPGTNWGTVYLMTGKEVGFWTHSLETGERRHHPTLECVEDADDLAMDIEKRRQEFARTGGVPKNPT